MSRAISVVVIGRSLSQQERARLRSASQTPLSIVAELPTAPQAIDELSRLRPQAALVILNGEVNHSFQLIERIRQEMPETAVVCSSEDCSSDIILQSFRSGATEFLRQPLAEDEISTVFAKIEQNRLQQQVEEAHFGRVVAVYASKGGCGTTFVTANLAASFARLPRKRACVVDLNLQAGDQPLYLGLEPEYSIYDIVRNFDRLDESLLDSYLKKRSKNLSLLAAPSEIGRDEDVRVEHITRIITMLRAQFGYVVVDPQHTLSEVTITALDLADDLVLLLTMDIPSIRSAKRALDIFTRLGYDHNRIKVVLNRYTKSPEFEIGQIEKVLETPVYAILSNDYHSAIASINVGEPLVQSKIQSRLVREFQTLASRLSGIESTDEVPAPPRSGWSSLFGKKR